MITRTYITPAALTLILALGLYQVLKPEPGAMQLVAGDIYVVDGDTIRIKGDSIRLEGFNTPETRFADCPEERTAGMAATERLRSILDDAHDIRLTLRLNRNGTPQRDKYRRLLGQLLADGTDAGTLLIREGHAEAYDGGQRRDWCA